MSRTRLFGILVCAAASLSATPMFVSGDLVWVATADARMYDVPTTTSNQNMTGATAVANPNKQEFGQVAWSADGSTAYLSLFAGNSVVSVDRNGTVTTFATGITSPTGLIRTSTGKLLVASYNTGNVYDITAGGNFTGASAWATGLLNPRNMVETPNGIYVAEQGSGEISNLGAGGTITSASVYATLSQPTDLAWYNGTLYAVANAIYNVYAITGAGAVNTTTPWAKGRQFATLAVNNGKLYAGSSTTDLSTSGIWDISTYTSLSYTSINPLAYNLPQGAALTAVPTLNQVTQSAVPEPGTIISGLALLGFGDLVRRRSRRS